MRTTLDIADDVLAAVRELARREKKTAGQVLTELARKGLHAPRVPPATAGSFFGFRPLPKRGVVVTNELIDQLREEDAD